VSHFGGFFYGGQFFEFSGDGVFFHGPFFAGGFFDELELVTTTSTGGKGDNSAKRKSIFKPTGLPPYRKTVEERVEESEEVAAEVVLEALVAKPPPIETMSLMDIEAEIGELLRKKIRTEDEELLLLVLAVAVAG
jgi:hypothetical protein